MIEIDNVSYRYEDAKRAALSDVTLNIPKGEFLAIVGHNGSGKSTLAKHLNALLLHGRRGSRCGDGHKR